MPSFQVRQTPLRYGRVKFVKGYVLHVVGDVYLCWQLLDIPAVAKKFSIEQTHGKQAKLQTMFSSGHLLGCEAGRVIATVCNDWQAIKFSVHIPPLHVSKNPW